MFEDLCGIKLITPGTWVENIITAILSQLYLIMKVCVWYLRQRLNDPLSSKKNEFIALVHMRLCMSKLMTLRVIDASSNQGTSANLF